MKRKDIALIVLVAVISAVLSIAISKTIFTKSSSKQQAEIVTVITSDFQEPDKAYFNSQAFDPTKQITIEQNVNTDPFKGPGQ